MTQEIRIERTYRATLQEIWDLWTTKDGFESWWGPVGFRAEVHAIDPRAGGAFRYDMIADTPEMIATMQQMGVPPSHEVRGTFAEIRPLERLVVKHVVDFLPGVAPYDTTITVELSRRGDRVTMSVLLDGMHDAAHTAMQQDGFTSQLTKLDERYK
jgi:uncharacterized protein YndB with AHSA1/START domain